MSGNKKISVDISLQRESRKFEGWGTSLCWWGNVIGRWENKETVEKTCSLLFEEANGLGLNILRYNLGGGENPPNQKNFRVGANMPCILKEDGRLDLEADKAQLSILKQAVKYGLDTLEIFLNSPPLSMLKYPSTAGADDGLCNLKEEMTEALAGYLADCALAIEKELDINVSTIAPFNEPVSFWWKSENDQEGCHFDVEEQSKLIEALADAIEKAGLKNTGISAPECWSTFESIYCINHYSKKALSQVKQINTHSYFSNEQSRKELYEVAKRLGKPLCMSEISCGGNASHNHSDMSGGIELAKNIGVHLNEMKATSWIYWQAVENELMKHNHGLIHANFEGEEEFFLTKQYYALGNYVKFIRPGMNILDSENSDLVIAEDEEKGKLVIVALNDSELSKILEFSSESIKKWKNCAIYKTSETESLENINEAVDGEYELTPYSVTTLLFEKID